MASTPIVPSVPFGTNPIEPPFDPNYRESEEPINIIPPYSLNELAYHQNLLQQVKDDAAMGIPDDPFTPEPSIRVSSLPKPENPFKPAQLYSGTEAYNYSPETGFTKVGPSVPYAPQTPEQAIAAIQASPETAKYASEHPEMVIPDHEIQAAEITKKILAKNAENIKPTPDGKGFWDYIDLTSKANAKPPIANPLVEQIKQAHEQQQAEIEEYRKATEVERPSIVPETSDESRVLSALGQNFPKKYMPSLGHLPTLTPLNNVDSQLEGLQSIPYWKKKLGL